MDKMWESREMHEHPAKHPEGRYGRKDRVTITMDPDMLSRLDALAASEHRSRSAMVEEIIRKFNQEK